MTETARRLEAAGMRPEAALAKERLLDRAERALSDCDGAAAERVRYFVPGRVEVLGKHTDYAGGRSLLCAVEQGMCLVAAPRADSLVRVIEAEHGTSVVFPLDPALEPRAGHWSNYPMTVARRVAQNFPGARRGADIAFAGDLPVAAGMSSSSALVVAVFLALSALNSLERNESYRDAIRSPEALGEYLGALENGLDFGSLPGDRGVGTFGGSEDQTAILCCQPGMLSRYSFCPVRAEGTLAFPAGHVLVIGVSGLVAEKAGAAREAYNRASLSSRAVLRCWNRATGESWPSLAAAVTSAPDVPERMRALLAGSHEPDFAAQVLLDRFEQFYQESEIIIPQASAALARGDVAAFGALVARSHGNAEMLLGNQVPETMVLVRAARTLGAAASSAFGAGFGGSVWALVPAAHADDFRARWLDGYLQAFPERTAGAAALITRPGPAATRL